MTSIKPDFSMVMASSVHDMKNSLSMLLQTIEEMCEDLPEEARNNGHVTTIQYEAERVNNFLIQLLGLYRLENKGLSFHIDEHYVEELLEEQEAHYDAFFALKGINLQVECEEPINWYFDRELVLGILNNALTNACRYTKDTIKLSAQMEDDYLVLKVEDNGEGYPESMLQVDPGEHSDSIDFTSGSTSLGIYFASEVAKLHKQGDLQGRITLENGGSLGGGVFSVYLP